MTRQAVSKHLAVLDEARPVVALRRGREKRHFLNPAPIVELAGRWIGRYERRAAQPEHSGGDFVGPAGPTDGLVGERFAGSSSPLTIMAVTIGVPNVPGQMALIRIPRGAYSRAALLVSPRTPCLDAW